MTRSDESVRLRPSLEGLRRQSAVAGGALLVLVLLMLLTGHHLLALLLVLAAVAAAIGHLLFWQRSYVWADDHWLGKVDLRGHRNACARPDLEAVDFASAVHVRFFRTDGRLGLRLRRDLWPTPEIEALVEYLGLPKWT